MTKRPCYACETGEGTHLLHSAKGLWPVWLCKECADLYRKGVALAKRWHQLPTVEEGPRK